MFETIVVGTNWSDSADVAFARALELAHSNGAALHVVTAHDPSPAPVVGGAAAPAAGPDFQSDVVLERALERLGAPEVQVRQHTSTAEPGQAILQVAEEVGADLIVVGNKGMRRRVLGSIPNTVSHRAACDVLIVQTS
jgi:nucleotide-binding universal stress UspA family protein